ncbi:MAG: DNA repair protein RecN [Clostridia bacterium]|nr:DNA repair protein RecN [Clostridia bacterium]
MLKFLHIENIAVIEMCDIELSEGLNVLTGETGAGKSIVIDAINAVLGERTSKDLIRSGSNEAVVSALFGDLSDNALSILKENDVDPDCDGNVLITRKLSLNGKGMIKINSKPFTATALREIALELINIHGQHDNQALLDPEKHCYYVDAVAENETLREEYYKEFKNLNRIRKELNSLVTDEDEKLRKTDLLKYQINELETADIKIGEIDELRQKLQIAENFEKNLKAFSTAKAVLGGDDDTDGVITKLKITEKMLSALQNEDAQKNSEALSEVISKTEDILSEITSFADNLSENYQNPNEINVRLDFLGSLMLKYGNSEEKMLSFLENAKKELEGITLGDKREAELEKELENAKLKLISAGETLSESRKAAAEIFSKAVCEILEQLNMKGVKFVTKISHDRYTSKGCDSVEFLISANRGEDVKPLHKIASGGELSRVMLSIKSALLSKDKIGTMIFDEIDAGISGFAADKVGLRLKRLAEQKQVICITHLAQIAAMADSHLLIEKHTENERTKTTVTPLFGDNRIKEIARIMSGKEITENIYNSAKELLDRSNI